MFTDANDPYGDHWRLCREASWMGKNMIKSHMMKETVRRSPLHTYWPYLAKSTILKFDSSLIYLQVYKFVRRAARILKL